MPVAIPASVSAQSSEPLQVFDAPAVGVVDGDTVRVRRGDGSLWQLDLVDLALPSDRKWAGLALRKTRQLVEGHRLHVRVFGPSATHWAATVELPDGRDLSALLVREGLARWVGWCEGRRDRVLEQAQQYAYRQRRGLWSLPGAEKRRLDCPRTQRSRPPDELPPLVLTAPPAAPPSTAPAPSRARGCIPRSSCCRVCSKGKACGNSCIQRQLNCHKGQGCACNSWEVCG